MEYMLKEHQKPTYILFRLLYICFLFMQKPVLIHPIFHLRKPGKQKFPGSIMFLKSPKAIKLTFRLTFFISFYKSCFISS